MLSRRAGLSAIAGLSCLELLSTKLRTNSIFCTQLFFADFAVLFIASAVCYEAYSS